MPYPCCGPHCSVCRISMSSVPCSSSIRFLYSSFSPIDVDTLLPMEVDCLLHLACAGKAQVPILALLGWGGIFQRWEHGRVSGKAPRRGSRKLAPDEVRAAGKDVIRGNR